MNLQIKSFGNLDDLKEGDYIWSPTLSSLNDKYICSLDKYKIEKFLAKSINIDNKDSKITFDKFDVSLERCTSNDDKSASQTLTTNIRQGFCTDTSEAKKQILALFKKELENMISAIDEQIENVKEV